MRTAAGSALSIVVMLLAAGAAGARGDRVTVGGEPRFPIGLYHVSGGYAETIARREPGAALGRFEALLDALQARGFDTVAGCPLDATSAAALRARGMAVIASVPGTVYGEDGIDEAALREHLAGLRPHGDRILFHYLMDEPYDFQLAAIGEVRERLHRLAPGEPGYLTSCLERQFAAAAQATDVLAIDPYPLFQPSGESQPIALVSRWMDAARRAHAGPVLLIPQCFAADDVWREPTVEELRCMVYQGLAGDCAGLIYYALHSGEPYRRMAPYGHWHLPHSALWDAVGELNAEVRALIPAMLAEPTPGAIRGVNPAVRFLERRLEGKTWLIAVNTTGLAQPAAFHARGIDRIERKFDNDPITFGRTGFYDRFEPYARRVYAIEGELAPYEGAAAPALPAGPAIPGTTVELSGWPASEPPAIRVGTEAAPVQAAGATFAIAIPTDRNLAGLGILTQRVEANGEVTWGGAQLDIQPLLGGEILCVTAHQRYPGASTSELFIELASRVQTGKPVEVRLEAEYGPQPAQGEWRTAGILGAETVPVRYEIPLGDSAPGDYPAVLWARMGADEAVAHGVRVCAPWRAARRAAPPVLDGRLDDWADCAPIPVRRRGDDNYFGRPFHGDADLSFDLYLGWDEEAFYVAASVTDDEDVLPAGDPDEIWQGDCLQVCFDLRNDGQHRRREYNADDYEYGLAQGAEGVVRRCWTKAGVWGRRAAPEVAAARVRTGSTTVWEAAVPWSAMPPGRPGDAGEALGFAAAYNDRDRARPRRVLHWGGSTVGPKFVARFADVLLAEE